MAFMNNLKMSAEITQRVPAQASLGRGVDLPETGTSEKSIGAKGRHSRVGCWPQLDRLHLDRFAVAAAFKVDGASAIAGVGVGTALESHAKRICGA